MLPTLISQCVVTLRDTALGFVITYPELLSSGKAMHNAHFNILPTAAVVGTIYVCMNLCLAGLARYLQHRSSHGTRRHTRVLSSEVRTVNLEVAADPRGAR